MEMIERQFTSFQNNLSFDLRTKYEETRLLELKELQKENEVELLKIVGMYQKVRSLHASKSYLSNLQCGRSIRRRGTMTKFEEVDAVLHEVLDYVVKTVDEELVEEMVTSTEISVKKAKEPSGKTMEGKSERLTRQRRKLHGGNLIDVRKFFVCVICGPKHMDYTKNDLRNHYKTSHRFECSADSLPMTKSQVVENITADQQQSTTCYICHAEFSDREALTMHKSLHVNPKFCRHSCSRCPSAFVLKEQLDSHMIACFQN